MMIRSQLVTYGLVILLLAGGLVCIASAADEVGGDTGFFEVTSAPSGGAVYFDNTYKGTTPVTFPVLVTGNPSHTIRVTKSGYNDWMQTYQGNPAKGETITVNAELVFIPVTEPTTMVGAGKGYYYVSSVPSGGSVSFDNAYKGTTPITIEVASQGTPGHTVRVSLSGYETWSTSLAGNPADGQTIPVTAYLDPVQNYGSISVTTNPSGATALLDGGSGQLTPCTFNNVNAGSHTVSLSKSGYTSVTRTVTVTTGTTTYVSATLGEVVPETGTLYIVSTPPGASTFVDGVYEGKTPALASGLSEGEHEVRISLSGFKEWTGTVNVEGGSTKTVSQTLTIIPSTPTQAPGTGTVSVSSNPPGAQVYIDNAYEGITPVNISQVQAGSHTVMIKMEGYADWQASELVQDSQLTQIAATLSPLTTPTEGGIPPALVLVAVSLLGIAVWSRRK